MEPGSFPSAAVPVDLEIRVSTPWGQGGQRLEFVVHSPSGTAGFHQERVDGQILHSPETFQRQLVDQLDALDYGREIGGRRGLQAGEIVGELESIGHDLYQALFPRQMRAIYREVAGRVRTLLLTSDEPWIPWELVRPCELDDDDFLCMRFQMSRWLTGDVPLSFEKEVRQMLVIEAGEGEGLECARREGHALQELARRTTGLEESLHLDAGFEEVVDLLGSARFDLIHLTGHGVHDDRRPAEARVRLPDRDLRARHLSPESEKRLRRRRPVVFFNTCQVGRLSTSLTAVDGWAQRWVRRCGCTVFLAPTWSVEDRQAARFAELLYSHLYDGRSLGEAVLLARHTLRGEDPGHLAWLAYSLYGAPNARILFGDHRPETTASVPLPHPDRLASSHVEGSMPQDRLKARVEPYPAGGRAVAPGERLDPGRVRRRIPRPLAGAAALVVLAVVLALLRLVTWAPGDPRAENAGGDAAEEIVTGVAPGGDIAESPEELGAALEQPLPASRGISRSEPPSSLDPTSPFPLEAPQAGRVGIVVLDRQTGRLDEAVSGAIRAALSALGPSIRPFVPALNAGEAKRLVQGDLSSLPGGDRAPWGAQYLLVGEASRKPLPQSSPHLESYSLALSVQLIDARGRSTVAWSDEAHTGIANSADGALAQAAERCLKPITITLTGGDANADSE